MTLRLILTRHAKSSWDDPAAADHDRPLNDRGRAAAPLIGRWLAAEGYLPDLVLTSDARRTEETVALILAETRGDPEIRHLRQLYGAEPETMLAALRAAPPATVLMVGHNPAIGDLAAALVATEPDLPRFTAYPTAATAVIDFDVDDWQDATPGSGRLVAFTVPRDLG